MNIGRNNKRPGSPGLAPDETKASKNDQDEMNSQFLFNPEQNIEFQKNVEQPANLEQIHSQSTLFHHPSFASDTILQPNQVQDMSWEQIVVEFKKSGKLCNAQNQVLYTSDIPKDLRGLIINCDGKFAKISYDETQGMSNLILCFGAGVFIAYLMFLKNKQIDVKRKEISDKFKDYFALALKKLKEKTGVDHKIEFLQAVVTMIGKLDLDEDTLKFIKETYNKYFYNFCAAVDDIVIRKEKARKAEETRKVDITYDKKILYLQTIPKDLFELIINHNSQFSDISYGGTRGISDLVKNYGEGVFIAYLLALKQREIYNIKPVKQCFELALGKLQEKTNGVKIKFLQAVVTMIRELSLSDDRIISITDAYNKKNITVDGYDFCDQINKLKLAKTLIMDSFIAFEGNDYTKILQCACYYFRTRNDTQGIPLDKVIENAGAIAKAFSEITYDGEDTNISLKIGDIDLYSKQDGEPNYQLLKDIFTFLKKGDKESSVNIVKFIQLSQKQKIDRFSTLFGKVMLNYGIIANQDRWNELAYGRSEFEAEKSSEPNFNDLEGYLDELPNPNDF